LEFTKYLIGRTQRDGHRFEFRELFRAQGNRRTKPRLRVIGRKTDGIRGGDSSACSVRRGLSRYRRPDEGQAKAVIAQPAEPSNEAEKNSSGGKTGRDHEVGDSSVAVVSFDGAAVDPLREASAALDDRDYATARRLFAAVGRNDIAEAIKDTLAALDRKDFAKAQELFEALGQKGAPAAQMKGEAAASPAPPKPATSAGVQWRPTPGITLNKNP
jgi:hypothetical protein